MCWCNDWIRPRAFIDRECSAGQERTALGDIAPGDGFNIQ
jgi:hypothetical protein